jgi:hypothetical protein
LGARKVFGEAGMGGVCLDQLQSDCLADLRLAGGILRGLRSGLGGHDRSLSLPRSVAGPMPAFSPSGAVVWGRARRPRKPLRTAVVRKLRAFFGATSRCRPNRRRFSRHHRRLRLGGEAGVAAADAPPKPHVTRGGNAGIGRQYGWLPQDDIAGHDRTGGRINWVREQDPRAQS